MRRRRSQVTFLHRSAFLLILSMIKGGVSTPWVLWAFVVIVTIWCGMAIAFGLVVRCGLKLPQQVRRAYPRIHHTLCVLLGLTAIAILFRLLAYPVPYLDAWTFLNVILAAGTFHGLFHFWRHTALYDNALRLITPRFMHKCL